MACVHLGLTNHPVKVGDYRDSIVQTASMISDQVDRSLTTTNFSIVLEATNELLGPLLLAREGDE